MDFDSILKNIAKHVTLEKAEIDHFISLLTIRKVPKKKILLQEGERCSTINYVHSGILRAYCHDKDFHERVIMFAVQDWWITDIHGFATGNPVIVNIEAIEDSVVFELQKNDLDDLYIKVPKFERVFRILMQNSYIREQLRTTQNLTLSAEERYANFVVKYPHVYQRVPLKQIASYLGITPEFLSVIRKKKGK